MGQENRKEEVVEAYLRGGKTFREMEREFGVSTSTIHRWVKEYGPEAKAKAKERGALRVKDGEVSGEVRRLQKELEEARLYNKLLNAMIDIAEEQFEIPIRKKSGAKR
jgi:transposase